MRVFLILACLTLMACGGAQKTDQGPVQEAPSDAEPSKLPSGPPVLVEGVATGGDSPELEAGSGEFAVQRAHLGDFMKKGPPFALTQVVVEPVHGDGGFVGYKLVSSTSGASEFLRPQVKAGDVITHLNGVRIERPDDYLRAWNALKDTSVIRIDFLREGQASVATWNVQ